MRGLLFLFAGWLSPQAFEPLTGGKNSVSLALERAQRFPGVEKTVILTSADWNFPLSGGIITEKQDSWTKKALFNAIAAHSAGFDLVYFAWADCPFLDFALAEKIAERHLQYAADYSYADGWPYGIAPELITPSLAAVLAKILGDDDNGPVERDTLFSVIQKDINAFDIETEISPVDLRCHRLNLCADSKRNLLLLRRFSEAAGKTLGGIPDAAEVERIIAEQPVILRTLPNFYPVQVFGGCSQACAFCPYPSASSNQRFGNESTGDVTRRTDFMEAEKFEALLEKITAFSGDAVIDLSLWGELALHPQKMTLIEKALARPELALVIETAGTGWRHEELERCAEMAHNAAASAERVSPLPPLSWIVSLDAADASRYRELRGDGFAEAVNCAKKLFSLFPKDAYVQAVRTTGDEDGIERFYRSWKEAAPSGSANVIIQKYDDFCGVLERRQASDLSPVIRQPCWHLMRDMPILIDGTVPRCRDDLAVLSGGGVTLGNAFTDSLDAIWEQGNRLYRAHCEQKYEGAAGEPDICSGCDEFYTYNF